MGRRQLRSHIETIIAQIMIDENNERAHVMTEVRKLNGWTAEVPEWNKTRQPGDWKTDLHLDIKTPEGSAIGVSWHQNNVQVCTDEMTEPYFETTVDLAMHYTNHSAIMDAIASIYAQMTNKTVPEIMALLKPVH